MTKDGDTEWRVLAHEPLEALAENLWRVVGDLPKMKLRRQMLVARAADGRLLIHNGVCVDEATLAELEAWGRPTWLVVPNAFHRLDAAAWKARFPELELVCPMGARAKVSEVVHVDETYASFEPTETLRLLHLRGVQNAEGVLEVRSEGGVTLVFNDAIFNQPHLPGLFGALYRVMGQSGKPKITMIAKRLLVKDRKALAAHLRQLADTPDLVRAVPAHIEPIEGDVGAVLRELADGL
ncbi:MAG: hypothetical protein AAGH15_12585 [Myxococcota bacterium]